MADVLADRMGLTHRNTLSLCASWRLKFLTSSGSKVTACSKSQHRPTGTPNCPLSQAPRCDGRFLTRLAALAEMEIIAQEMAEEEQSELDHLASSYMDGPQVICPVCCKHHPSHQHITINNPAHLPQTMPRM